MIASLRGKVLSVEKDAAVIEAGGVGYEVFLGNSSLARLPSQGEEVFLFISESAAMYGGKVRLERAALGGLRAVLTLPAVKQPGTG